MNEQVAAAWALPAVLVAAFAVLALLALLVSGAVFFSGVPELALGSAAGIAGALMVLLKPWRYGGPRRSS